MTTFFWSTQYYLRSCQDTTSTTTKKKSTNPRKTKQVDKISTALELIRTKDTTVEENLALVLEDFNSNSRLKEQFPGIKIY